MRRSTSRCSGVRVFRTGKVKVRLVFFGPEHLNTSTPEHLTMIYLDHATTTPLHPDARRAMEPFLAQSFGNPSSLHAAGQEARRALDAARDDVACRLGVASEDVVFPSGGTEADKLALIGVFLLSRHRPRIITVATEHHAVL